ncbi:MAG TPA: hypothetical protein VM328_03570 [Fimbriimonadaceae bacterium]|nr:hypothetical protein [Fimbriimonadaceae bacterium]
MTQAIIGALVLLSPQGTDADRAAEDVMNRLTEKLKQAKTISCVMEGDAMGQRQRIVFKAMKPDLYVLKLPDAELYADGSGLTVYSPDQKQFQRMPKGESDSFGPTVMLFGFGEFLGKMPFVLKASNLRSETLDGKEVQVIDLLPPTAPREQALSLQIDPQTGLPVGWSVKQGAETVRMAYRDVVLNAPLQPSEFKFVPPAGVKEVDLEAAEPAQFDTLKKGAKVAAFSLKTPEGKALPVNAATLKKNKATIINFWFYG